MNDTTQPPYARDMVGYGRHVPHAQWPGQARIAVQFVLNYEEGGENNVLHGDPTSETFLSEMVTAQAYENRHMTMESMYEYGSRAGVWRVLREFEKRGLPLTVFGVSHGAAALPRTRARVHGTRPRDRLPRLASWIHYQNLPEATEREHMALATHIIERPDRRPVAAGLVHRPRQPQHAPPAGRPGRLRVRQRLLRRRPAVLDEGDQIRRQRGAAPGGALHAGHATTCALCRPRASTPANTSSPT